VSVCRQDVWFHQGSAKAGNAAGLGQSTLPSWDTTKPAASVTSGAGGGYATVRLPEILTPYDRTYRPTFAGTYTGTLDNLAASIYLTAPAYQATGTDFPLLVRLTIDDEVIFEEASTEIDVPIKPAGNVAGRIDFAFTELFDTLAELGLDNAADTTHAIELTVINRYWGDGHTVVLYDTSEVASGLVFNLEASLQNYTVIETSFE
jgi:hypothetical protein